MATLVGEVGALLTSVSVAGKVFAEAGANEMLNAAEPPGAIESGRAKPVIAKEVPARVACVTMRLAVPGF